MIKYLQILAITFFTSIEYRINFIFGLLSKFFPVIIQFFLWTAVYSNSQDPMVLGYTYSQMITYTLMAVFTSNLVFAGVSGAIAGEIKSGGYNKYIVLPVSHLRWKIAEFMGDKLFAIIVVFIGMAVVLGLLAVNRLFVPELSGVLSYLIVLIPAIALQFLLNYCVAGCAFWMGEIGGIFTIINIINAIVSGGVFPLDIFGPVVVAISKVLPFYYTTYFAVNVFIGRISGAELFEGIVVMLCWIAVLYVVVCIVWARGMRRYIAAGG